MNLKKLIQKKYQIERQLDQGTSLFHQYLKFSSRN